MSITLPSDTSVNNLLTCSKIYKLIKHQLKVAGRLASIDALKFSCSLGKKKKSASESKEGTNVCL